jgi:hypothetical protein
MENHLNAKQWEQLKLDVRRYWRNLSENDIEASQGNMSQLANKISQLYHQSIISVRARLEDMIEERQKDFKNIPKSYPHQQDVLDKDQEGIIVDSREADSQEWDIRSDINSPENRTLH